MTIVQINSVVNMSSDGRIAENIGRLIISKGWNSYIAYGREAHDSRSHLLRIGTTRDVLWHVMQTRLFDRHGFASTAPTHALIAQLSALRPDIIHLHNIHGYYLNIELLFTYLAACATPVIWTLHDCWAMTGHCAYFEYVECNRWKTGCFQCPQKDIYPASWGRDQSQTNYRVKKELFTSVRNMILVPVSQWLDGLIGQSYLRDVGRRVIHNGIDLTGFRPRPAQALRRRLGGGGKKIILGVAMQWGPRKGLEDFLRLGRLIGPDTVIVLAGVKSALKRTLPANIIGISQTESIDKLAELYSAADVFVNPTWDDNFPTTNLEALACGTPVITYRSGGCAEAVSPDTGLIEEKGNIRGLNEKIRFVLARGKAAYSESCLERARRLYDKDRQFEEYIQLYDEMIRSKTKPHQRMQPVHDKRSVY